MEDLRSVVLVGDNIYSAKKKIQNRYHSVSKVHDPTGCGEKLRMDVSFGLKHSALESFSYAAELNFPSFNSEPLGALIEANPSGTIINIK